EKAAYALPAGGERWSLRLDHNTKHASGADRNFEIATKLHPEDLRVARLDLFTHALDAGGIVLPQLDLVEPARPRLLFGEGVDRMLTGEIDQELLRLERMQPVLGQARGGRVWRGLEHRARAGDERRAFGRINDLDRLPRLLELDQIVIVAIGHHRALAERELLRRVGRRLHLHDLLLGQFFEVLPAEFTHDLERGGHD